MADPVDHPNLPARIAAERSQLAIPSLPHWIEPTVEFLRQKAVLGGACDETRSGKLLIALHEAITNAVVHGNLEVDSDLKEQGNDAFAQALAQRSADPEFANRKVDIAVDYNGDVCHWIITDQGRGFDVQRVLDRCLSDDPEILLASGRGILMMKSFLDDVRFELGGRRVILSLRRNSGEERRTDQRLHVSVPFQVTPVDDQGTPDWARTYEAVSRNFSEHGISLLQQQLATSGQVLIGVPTENGIIHVPAEVRHSRALGANGMELGCQFLQPISPHKPLSATAPTSTPEAEDVKQAVSAILENYQGQQTPSHERRVHPRVVFNERIAVHGGPAAGPVVGFARDLSRGGIAFIAQHSMSGDVLIVLSASETRPELKVRSRIVRCTRIQDGFYDIGAAFMQMESRRSD